MKTLTFKSLTSCLAVLLLYGACSEPEAPFVLRSTDNLVFGYSASDQTFTIATNGDWSVSTVDHEWITVTPASGRGDGETREVVTVSVSRNMSDAREGRVAINAAGDEIYIDVRQEEGHMVLGLPAINRTFVRGESLEDTYLTVPYSKGILDEDIVVSAEITGTGASGISIPDATIRLSEEEGSFDVPLQGIPDTEGEVNITVTLNDASVQLSTVVYDIDPGSVVYLEQDFNLLVLGGDHVGKAPGLHLVGDWPTVDGQRVLPENPLLEVRGTANTDGTGDYFNTMHPSFVEARGLAGWSGRRVYERPGYVKISTAGSTDGYIATPPLSEIDGEDDVKVTFKAARWSQSESEDQGAKLMIEVVNGGTVERVGAEIDLEPNWEEKEFVIRGATPETVIQFRAKPMANNRIMLDDIVVSRYIE